MQSSFRRKLELIWEKNSQEILATLSGRFFQFGRNADSVQFDGKIPVFVFHSIEPIRFENQLRFLAQNGYHTVDSDTLFKILKTGKKGHSKVIALTFDDATGSFWASGFPLLKKYGFKAIVFAIPGLIPDDEHIYPNLEDVWAGRTPLVEIKSREHIKPLCTWREVIKMHQSGFVDIQSHSLTHSRINVSPKVVDFIHPHFNPNFYENVNIPVSRNDRPERPLRKFILGRPVYQYASRLSGCRRFLEDTSIGDILAEYVANNGNIDFFYRTNWRKELKGEYRRRSKRNGTQTQFENHHQKVVAIEKEMVKSKQVLERRLAGKAIRHFCYPWFQGAKLSDRIAGECGYQAVYYGSGSIQDRKVFQNEPFQIQRISEEYLFCLPGEGRQSLPSVWALKMFRLIKSFKRRNLHSL